MARSKLKGSKSFRRILRGLPEATRAEMADVLTKTGPAAAAIVEGRVDATTKRGTGRLRAGVKWKVYPRTLRLQVGYLGTKAGRAKLFYARILDLGRKAQTVNVTRRANAAPYQMKVRAIAPKRFVTGGMGALRQVVSVRLRGVFDRALRRIGGGDE
jgi:hypothetical protein